MDATWEARLLRTFSQGNRKENRERLDKVFPKDFCGDIFDLTCYVLVLWALRNGTGEGDKWAILGQAQHVCLRRDTTFEHLTRFCLP